MPRERMQMPTAVNGHGGWHLPNWDECGGPGRLKHDALFLCVVRSGESTPAPPTERQEVKRSAIHVTTLNWAYAQLLRFLGGGKDTTPQGARRRGKEHIGVLS
jgi:hypothetical protein